MADETPGKRPLTDAILLVITIAVAACLVVGLIGVVTMRVVHPDEEIGVAASSLGTLLSALAGYVIGMARRKTDKDG